MDLPKVEIIKTDQTKAMVKHALKKYNGRPETIDQVLYLSRYDDILQNILSVKWTKARDLFLTFLITMH